MITNNHDHYLTGPFFKATQGQNLFDLVKLEMGSYIFEKRNSVHFHKLKNNFNTPKRETLIMTWPSSKYLGSILDQNYGIQYLNN